MSTQNDVRVYEAEGVLRILGAATGFHTIQEAQAWADMVQYDRHVLAKYPDLGKFHIELRNSKRYEWAGAHTHEGFIMCPPWSLNDLVIGHEMAHFGAGKETEGLEHGPIYCGCYIYLLHRFVSHEASRSVKLAYQAYGVEYELR
jgi:hypothetical protein